MRKWNARRLTVVAVAAIAAAVICFVTVKHLLDKARAHPASANAADHPTVEVTKVARETLFHRIDVPATLEAFDQTDLYAKVSGYVSEVKADIGDHVSAGQALAVIALPEMEKQLAQAKAEHESKQNSLAAAGAAVEQAQKLLETAHKQLDHYTADLDLQQITLKRQEELLAGKGATPQQVDEVRSKSEMAKADVAVAQAKIAGAEADVRAAEANRAVAAAQVKVAAAQVDLIETLLKYTKIVAPFDGVVTRRIVNPGDLVQAAAGGRTLFTVQSVATIRVLFDVPEGEVTRVRKNDPAKVTLYGTSDPPLTGTVTRLAVGLNPDTRTMRTEIDLANKDEKLHPGMYAQVSLEANRRQNILTVPVSAIGSDASAAFVSVVDHDRIVRTPVKVGLKEGDRAEIAEGLSDGAVVVTAVKAAPAPGTEVRVNSTR